MPLTILGGLPGSGARDALYEELTRAIEAGRGALLVVATSAEAVRARRVLAVLAPVGVRVATLDGLIEAEWAVSGDGRRFVRGLQRDILLARSLAVADPSARHGRGAIALLGTIAARAAAVGAQTSERPVGVPGHLLTALSVYNDLLGRHGMIEPADAAQALARLAPPASDISVDGLVELDVSQLSMLAGWSSSGAAVRFTLPWSGGVAATQPLAPLVARLVELGACVVDLQGPVGERSVELERIANDLFAGSAPRSGQGHVRLGVARGTEGEARLIARMVRDLAVAGVAPERIAIALPDPRRNLTWLLRALTDAGLHVALDVRVPVTETPLGRALLHLWSFCHGGLSREDLTAFLRTPFSGVPLNRVDEADAAWRHSGTARGEALLRRVPEVRGVVTLCRESAQRVIDSETAIIWKSVADCLLATAHPGMAPVPDAEGALDAAVHRSFVAALEQAVQLGDGEVSSDELWTAFAASSVNTAGAAAAGRVLVTSLDEVWRHDPDHVVLAGLTASEMPRRGSDDRLEGDAVRTVLSALGLACDAEEHLRHERLMFYLTVSSPRESVALARRESDDEGRALRESVFWDEFLDLYRAPGDLLPPDGLPHIEHEGTDEAEPRGARCSGTRGSLRDSRVLESLASIEAVSPGEVEAYASCPYRWYIERRLRPRSPDTAVDAMAAGRAAHDALARFYRDRIEGGRGRVTPDNIQEAIVFASAEADRAVKDAPAATDLEERRLLGGVAPSVISLVARDAEFLPGYRPEHVEWSFGLDGDDPVDVGGVLIKGRADRIDVGPGGLVVVDYKRGHASSLTEIRRDRLVQLQLYAAVASIRLGIPVAGGLYRSLSNWDDRGFALPGVGGGLKAKDVLEREGVNEVITEAVEVARRALEGMRAGMITPTPLKERCAHCAASSFCSEGVRS